MEFLQTIRKGLDKILCAACIFLFGLMVVVGTYQIVTRFIFNSPSTVSEELLTYSLHGWPYYLLHTSLEKEIT